MSSHNDWLADTKFKTCLQTLKKAIIIALASVIISKEKQEDMNKGHPETVISPYFIMSVYSVPQGMSVLHQQEKVLGL